MTEREQDIERFYNLLGRLEERVGPKRKLANCHWNMGWPDRGVYFFFEKGETRSTHPTDLRVVRIGTHAVTARSRSKLWHRLYEHKQDGGRSVFRDHVNKALRNRAKCKGSDRQHNHTRCISRYIGQMPFLWVNVDGHNGHKMRTFIESNVIKLLSARRAEGADLTSSVWLGRYSDKEQIQRSGLWNVQHTKGHYVSSFLDELELCFEGTGKLKEPSDEWDSPLCVD